jgi:hypothetical protein
MVNQSELSTNTQSQDGLKFHDDIEVIKAPHFLSTSFIWQIKSRMTFYKM